jgi:hypothetical protein
MAKSNVGLIPLVPLETIETRIFVLRGGRIMLDRDLAELYGAPVKRNSDRFPDDFMFQLKLEEGKAVLSSRSQIATLNRGQNVKYRPYAFTEHGAVMLANVLMSPVAVRASIQVVRAFVHLRQLLATNTDLARRIEAVERKVGRHDADLEAIRGVLQKLLQPPAAPPNRPIGFVGPGKKQSRSSTGALRRL